MVQSEQPLSTEQPLLYIFLSKQLAFRKRSPVSLITWMKAERLHHACMNTATTRESQVGY